MERKRYSLFLVTGQRRGLRGPRLTVSLTGLAGRTGVCTWSALDIRGSHEISLFLNFLMQIVKRSQSCCVVRCQRTHHGDRTPRLIPTVNQAQRLPEGLSRGKETPAGHKGDTPLSPQTASPPWGPADLPQEGGGASLPCLLPFKQSFLYLSNQNERSW